MTRNDQERLYTTVLVGPTGERRKHRTARRQAAAQVEAFDFIVVFVVDALDELDHHVDGLTERMQRKDLRAYMAVQAYWPDPIQIHGSLVGIRHLLGGNAELGGAQTGGDLGMGLS